jgi:site-specific recombinase XerD
MLKGGMDIHKVQELLSHANISTTQVCTQVDRGASATPTRRRIRAR